MVKALNEALRHALSEDERTLILGEQRGEAVIGDEGSAFILLIHCQPQWSIQCDFWQVFDHLDSEQRIANGILAHPPGFSCQGEQGSMIDLTEEAKTA